MALSKEPLSVGLAVFRRKSKVKIVDTEESKMETESAEKPKIKLLDRWSIRGICLGLGMGVIQTFSMGYTSIGFMIGLGIPFAIFFGLVGLVVDYFKSRKHDS
jgi:hypothetical protein